MMHSDFANEKMSALKAADSSSIYKLPSSSQHPSKLHMLGWGSIFIRISNSDQRSLAAPSFAVSKCKFIIKTK